jgi:thiol-disulfide isomerase/thioredoxin
MRLITEDRQTMKRNLFIIALVLLLAGIAIYQDGSAKDKETTVTNEIAPKPNYLAPSFELQDMRGETYKVGGKRDKPLLVNFWASWCGPCYQEAPDLKLMYDKYKDRLDLYAVNVTRNDNMTDVKDFVNEFKFDFPVLLDKEGTTVQTYRFQTIPTSFLIDRNGVIVDVFNVLEKDDLERRIKKLVNS